MSAKQAEPVKKVNEVNEVKERQKQEEVILREQVENAAKSEKAKKSALIMTVEELEKEIVKLKELLRGTITEYNVKMKVNENLGASIASAQARLAEFDTEFNKKNEERLKVYDKKLKDVNDADKELQTLIQTNRKEKEALSVERSQFNNERESNRRLVVDMQNSLTQANAMWATREADILEREKVLAEEKTAFEAYKDGLKPEIARITSIKNENENLLKNLEIERAKVERIRLEASMTKDSIEQAKAVAEIKAKEDRAKLLNEEGRLRKWEQDLKDFALEVKVQSEEAQKMMKRYELTKKSEN